MRWPDQENIMNAYYDHVDYTFDKKANGWKTKFFLKACAAPAIVRFG
jgi:hypothetical protein